MWRTDIFIFSVSSNQEAMNISRMRTYANNQQKSLNNMGSCVYEAISMHATPRSCILLLLTTCEERYLSIYDIVR